MKSIITLILFSLFMDSNLTAQTFKTPDDSLAYSLGVLIAGNLLKEGYGDLNTEIIYAGLKAGIKKEPTLFTTEQCGTIVRESSIRRQMKQYDGNRVAGLNYLAANSKRPGVVSLDNGLQYEVLKAGDGAKPTLANKVLVHYHGTLIDGTVFDSSVDRGEPITFGLHQVIKGWTEILQLMPIGSKWRVYIPYQLAYGERAAGAAIQPFSALIFEIELLGIE